MQQCPGEFRCRADRKTRQAGPPQSRLPSLFTRHGLQHFIHIPIHVIIHTWDTIPFLRRRCNRWPGKGNAAVPHLQSPTPSCGDAQRVPLEKQPRKTRRRSASSPRPHTRVGGHSTWISASSLPGNCLRRGTREDQERV